MMARNGIWITTKDQAFLWTQMTFLPTPPQRYFIHSHARLIHNLQLYSYRSPVGSDGLHYVTIILRILAAHFTQYTQQNCAIHAHALKIVNWAESTLFFFILYLRDRKYIFVWFFYICLSHILWKSLILFSFKSILVWPGFKLCYHPNSRILEINLL